MSPALFRLREALQLLGWRLAWVAPLWAARPRYVVVARSLEGPLPLVPDRPELRCTPLSEADMPLLTSVDPALDATEIRRRLREGQRGHVYRIGEAIAHYRFEATGRIFLPYLGLTFHLLPATCAAPGPSPRPRSVARA